MPNDQTKIYDLEERTAQFAEAVISLYQAWPKNPISLPILDQLIRSATSIGANYCEANGASSKKDLRTKFTFVKKKPRKPSIGSDCSPKPLIMKSSSVLVGYYGKKPKSSPSFFPRSPQVLSK